MGRPPKKRLSLAVAVALRFRDGGVCAGCKSQCVDEPSELEPLYVETMNCPACGGSGGINDVACCDCQSHGKLMLTSCPQKLVTPETSMMLRAADFARKGVLPVAGGWLDQADAAMSAIQYVWTLERPFRIKHEMGD